MKKLIKLLERINAQLLILRYRLSIKNDATKSNGVLVFADLGIGDLVMFLPVIQVLYSHNYNLYFRTERAEAIEILKGIFPGAHFIMPYKKKNGNAKFIGYEKALLQYKFCAALVNFHQAYKSNILPMVRLKIPTTIGHSWSANKYNKIWTHPVEYDPKGYQVAENLKLLKPLELYEIGKDTRMFFKIEAFKIPFKKFILIQPASYTQKEKNCWDVDAYIKKMNLPIIFIGSVEEDKTATHLMCNNPHSRIVNYCGTLNIFQTAYLIEQCKEFYCNEGGLAHIASALCVRANVFVNAKIQREQIYHNNLNYIFV